MRQIIIAVVAALGVATAVALAGGPIRPGGIRAVKVGSNGILSGSGTTANPLTATISVDGTTVTGTGSAGSPLTAAAALSGGTDGDLAVWDGSDGLTNYAGAGTCATGTAVTTFNAAGSATCSTFFDTAGTGLSASDNTVTLAMTAKTCTSGQHLSAATATGVFTCSADSYSHPATTCDAGSAMTAVDSSGDGTCSAVGNVTAPSTLTDTYLPMADASGHLVDSSLHDNGTILQTAREFRPDSVSVAHNWAAFGGVLRMGDNVADAVRIGGTPAIGDGAAGTLNYGFTNDAPDTGWINKGGYDNGTTQPRSLNVGDGQGSASTNVIAHLDASDHSVTIPNGPLVADGNITAGDSGSDTVETKGALYLAIDTTPAISSCGGSGAAITGTNASGSITWGTSAGSCVLTFGSPSYTHVPDCVGTAIGGNAIVWTSDVSETAVTFHWTTGTTATALAYHCFAHKL